MSDTRRRMQLLVLEGEGVFSALPGISAGLLRALLEDHGVAQHGERCLKRKYDTVVTRVALSSPDALRLGLPCGEAVVKQSPVSRRGRFLHRLGFPSRLRRDARNVARLGARAVATPRVLAHSLRPEGAREFLVTEYIAGRTLRELLWLGRRVVAGSERDDLLAALGRWLRDIHEQGVWQRDLKPENVIRGESAAAGGFYLLDTTAVRFFRRGLPRARRLRNLGQVLDVPERLDSAVLPAFLGGYLRGSESPREWAQAAGAAIRARRDRRAARTGFRHVDEEYAGTKGALDV